MPIIAATRSLIWPMRQRATRSMIWRLAKSTAPFPRYAVFMEMFMKRVNGSPQLYLASSAPGKTPVVDSDKRLRSVIRMLEECQALLAGSANRDAAQLLAMAVLPPRVRGHLYSDSELKAHVEGIT